MAYQQPLERERAANAGHGVAHFVPSIDAARRLIEFEDDLSRVLDPFASIRS